MSSPSTTASSIPTTPTTPFSLPSPLPNLDAAMNPSMKSSSHSMPHLSLPPPVVPRPRRIALHPSFKLQAPPVSLRSRTAIIEEQEDEEGCDKLEIHVPTIVLPAKSAEPAPARPRVAPLAPSNTAPAPPAILSPSATRPNKTFADAVAGRNPPPPPAPIASSSTMSFGKLSGQPRSTKAGARTHRRAQSISMSVSDSAGFAPRRAPLAGSSDSQEQVLMVPRRPSSLTPSPRMVHFAPIPETDSDQPPRAPRAAHPRVSALAPPHPGLRSFGLAPPSRLHSREDSTPRALANSGRIIALPSFEDDAFTSMRGSSYAFGTNPVAIAVGRGFDQWGQ